MSHDYVPPVTDPALYQRVPVLPHDATDNPRGRSTKTGAIAGIAATAALAVGIALAVTSQGSASAQKTGQQGGLGGQTGQFGPRQQGGSGSRVNGAPGGGAGGVAGEQHVTGTITAVTASSITVRSTSGAATYLVNGTTEIIEGGATAALSSLKTGTTVSVHVYPSGSSMMAERIIVGTDDFGPGGFGGPPGQQAPATTT